MKRILLLSLSLLMLGMGSAMAQRTVTGTVTSATDGYGIPGTTVRIKGTSQGVTTDFDGKYRIDVPGNDAVLLVSSVGFITVEEEVGSRSTIDVVLEEDVKQLDEVVVVGYQALRKADLTTSVSTVKGDMVQAQPIASVDNLLQGTSPGVLVTNSNGRPGGNAYIRIRGVGSYNASNEPLFIVDGVQVGSADYNALNPNDIESINILKDAASTSIYGARAANGVVVVTTKRGSQKKNKPTIAYTFQKGQKEMIPLNFDIMNKEQKLQYEVELGIKTQEQADALMNDPSAPETDWQDVLLREGQVDMHDFSIANSGELSNFYLSLSSYSEEGIAKGSGFDRLTGRLNFDTKTTDWLQLGSSISVAQTETAELRDRNNVQNPFSAMLSYNPYEPEFVLDGEGNPVLDGNGDPVYNLTRQGFSISEAIVNNPESSERLMGLGNFFANITPIENLLIRSQVGVSHNIYRREYYIYPNSVLDGYVGDESKPGIKTDNGSDRTFLTFTNTADYSFTIGDAHNLNFLGGVEYVKYNIEGYSLNARGFPNKRFSTLDNAAEITDGSSYRDEFSIWSQFGQMRYDLNEKYFATASIRRDGSSRFGKEEQYGVFWAGSLGWNIAEEAFLQNVDWLEQLKVRGSVGTSGNVPSEFYANRGLYGFGSYNQQTTAVPTQLENSTLKWEENFNYTVGLDFGLFRNRLSGSVAYYNRVTGDLLFNQPLSRTTGWSSRLANVGEFENSGVEAEINGIVYDNNGLKWNVFGSIATNQSEVTELPGGDDIINSFSGVSLLREGEEVNTYYLVRYAGVNPVNGEPLYYTKDGEITNVYNADDAVALEGKSTLPSFFGNFGTSVAYKGFSLDANFYYQGGNYIFNYQNEARLLSDGNGARAQQRVDAFNYWKQPGDVGVLPAPALTNNINDSDRYLQKGDFIRLRNVRLGYSLPKSLLDRVYLSNVTLFVQGTNLWTYNPYFSGDPEVGRGSEESDLTTLGEFTLFTYPNTRGMTFGVNVRF